VLKVPQDRQELKEPKDRQELKEPKVVKEISVVPQELKVLKDHKGRLKEQQVLKVILVLQGLQVTLVQQGLKGLHHKELKVQKGLKEPQELQVLMGLKEQQGLKGLKELKVFQVI
jgi:hypothetical protein